MRDRKGIAHVIPDGFDAYVRVHHPLRDGRRWADAAPSYLRRMTARYEYPFPTEVALVQGDMGTAAVDGLVAILQRHTTTAERCHFGLWNGWGDLHPGSNTSVYVRETTSRLRRSWRQMQARRLQSAEVGKAGGVYSFVDACPVEPWWGARNMLLFDGPIGAVASIGSVSLVSDDLHRRGPQWWWPADRAWFVATEIDFPWSYIGGSKESVAEVRDSDLETVDVGVQDDW